MSEQTPSVGYRVAIIGAGPAGTHSSYLRPGQNAGMISDEAGKRAGPG